MQAEHGHNRNLWENKESIKPFKVWSGDCMRRKKCGHICLRVSLLRPGATKQHGIQPQIFDPVVLEIFT